MKNTCYILFCLSIVGIQCTPNTQRIDKQKAIEVKEKKVINKTELMQRLNQEFEQIIQYHLNKGELHNRGAIDERLFVEYLLGQTEYTKQRLNEVIQKVNYETIKPYETCWPALEFWRGVDDYDSAPALNYDGDVLMLADETPINIGQYDLPAYTSSEDKHKAAREKKAVKIDLKKHPISILGHYKYAFNETALFYAWIGYLWQEIDGYKCGIQVRTIQNNSIATYCLNDFLEGDFSSFKESNYGAKPPKLKNFFPRKLSLIELYLRASQQSSPYNPYKNYWRYFEKGDMFIEIVTYGFATGIRQGKIKNKLTSPVTEIIRHDNSGAALKRITEFSNTMIFEGWREQLRPLNMPAQMHENAFDFHFWTGVSWENEQIKSLPESRVKQFEREYKIKLPISFFYYLQIFNGRQYNSYHMYFPINDLYTVRIKKFYTIEEIEDIANKTLNNDPEHLWIAETNDNKKIGININPKNENYNKIVISKNDMIEICDYSFEKFAKYSQNTPVEPEIFAAEENDVEFLKKRVNEGWDFNTIYHYQNVVTQAAESNSHEVLEFLMQIGAKLKDTNYKNQPYIYDEKTMNIIDKYQKN